MSSGTKVYKYRCNICMRITEKVSDNRRPDPLHCTITNQCLGFLEPKGSYKGNRAKFTQPASGLTDRVPRGSSRVNTLEPKVISQIGLTTFNGFNGLVIAAPRRAPTLTQAVYSINDSTNALFQLEARGLSTLAPALSAIIMLVYELTSSASALQHFTYTFNGVAQTVEGIDNSKEQRLLRFGPTDIIKVAVNGVELAPSQYDRTLNDSIKLTPSIIASELIVEIIVYQDRSTLIDEAKLIRLRFTHLSTNVPAQLAIRQSSAWGDVGRLTTPDGSDRSLLFCADLSKLTELKSYGIARFEAISAAGLSRIIDPKEIWLLLSNAPHSFIDKRADEIISGGKLVEQQFSFSFSLSEASGLIEPVADATTVSKLLKRLTPSSEVSIIPTSNAGAQRAYIKRPDAFIIGPA
jgi:hypothetical protein